MAYCFMPDHMHMVVTGQNPDADLRRFAKIAKQRVVYSLRETHGVDYLAARTALQGVKEKIEQAMRALGTPAVQSSRRGR